MARLRVPLSSFEFGEVSPSLTSRTDVSVYNASAAKIRNFFIKSEGGVEKRSGTQNWHTFTNTYTKPTCTITVTDFANIVVGTVITLTLNDGTEITLTSETSSSNAPSNSVGNNHFFRPFTDNNTTADNIQAALNAVTGLTVANPAANVVTVTRDDHGSMNLNVVTQDSTRLAVTNFSSNPLQVRIEPFIFSDDERYIVAFSAGQIEVFLLDPTNNFNPKKVSTITQDSAGTNLPFTQTKVIELQFAQQADVMFITHQLYPILKLVRTGLETFVVNPFEFEVSTDGNSIQQPYFSFQGTGVTLESNQTTGNGATLTTSASYFVSDHVGTKLKMHSATLTITAVANGTSATANISGTIRQQLDIDALETISGSNRVLVTHALHGLAPSASITIDRASGVGGLSAGNINGSRTVAAVIDENVYEITAGASATASTVGGGSPRIATGAATTQWEEQSYSSLRGYPSCVTFHEGRLWFAGSLAQPSNIWASHSNNFFNFSLGDGEDDEGIDISANVGSFDQIRHMVSNRDLQVFTSDSEFFVPSFSNAPVTPTTAQIKRQTPFGSSFVRPAPFDGATLFVQKTESAIREYIFSDTEGAYVATNISTLSPHLIRNPLQQSLIKGALNKPESYAFYVNKDGTIAVFYSLRADKKAGWSLWDTNGLFQSICSVGERLFTVVIRDDGTGTSKFYLEEFNNSMPMDHCNVYNGTAGLLSGLGSDFENGAVVKVVSGTDYLGEYTIGSAQVNVSAVDNTVKTAFVGYAFTPQLVTLPVDGRLASGPLTGKQRRITSVILDLFSTLSVSVDGTDMIIRNVTDDFALDREAFTGKKEFFVFGYSRDPQVTISQFAPLDLQLNGMVLEVAY